MFWMRLEELRMQVDRIDEAEKRASRIRFETTWRDRNLLAARKRDARRPLAFDDDPSTLRRSESRRRRVAPHAASASARAPRPPRGVQPDAMAWRVPRSHASGLAALPADRGPRNAPSTPVGRHDRAQRLALEPFGGEIGHRHRQPSKQPISVSLAERAEMSTDFEQRQEVPGLTLSMAGGGSLVTARSTPPIAATLVRKRWILAPSRDEKCGDLAGGHAAQPTKSARGRRHRGADPSRRRDNRESLALQSESLTTLNRGPRGGRASGTGIRAPPPTSLRSRRPDRRARARAASDRLWRGTPRSPTRCGRLR